MRYPTENATVSDGSIIPSRSDVSTTFSNVTDTTQKHISSMGHPATAVTSTPSLCKSCPTPVSSASSLSPSDSASNYDPAVARLNLPKSVIAQLEKLVAAKPKVAAIIDDPDAPTPGMKIRFFACIIVLVTLGFAGIMANSLGVTNLNGLLAACLTLFAMDWFIVYGSGLSRQRRTYFNEKNVLDTYKIYDREFGHLFQKEPDTPGNCCGPPPNPGDPNTPVNPVQTVATDLLAQYKVPPTEKAEFNEAVQNHYGNMYDNIRRINQEMDLMAKAKQANADAGRSSGSQSSTGAHPQNPVFVPADLPLPGQKPSVDHNNNNAGAEKK